MSSAEERGSVAEAPPEHEQQNGDGFDPAEAEQREHPGSFDPGLETGYLRRGPRDHELPVEIGAAPFDPGPARYDTRRAKRAARRREKAERKRRERAERQERERRDRERAEKERRDREAREGADRERREREERARSAAETNKREAELRRRREERQRAERERATRVQAEGRRLRAEEKEREEQERKLEERERAERKRKAQIERQVALKEKRERQARERAERERREQENQLEKERKARIRAKREKEKRERKDRRRAARQQPKPATPKRRPTAQATGVPTKRRPAAQGTVARPRSRPTDAAVSLKPSARPRPRAKPTRITGVQPGRTSLKRPTAKAGLALAAVIAFAIGAGALLGLPVPVLSSDADEPATASGDAALAALATGTPVELTEGPYFPVVLDGPFNDGESAAKFHADRGGRKHEGQDVFAKPGTPLVAVRDGVVLDGAGGTNFYESGGGNSLVLHSPVDNRSYVYLHMLKPPLVKAGDQVSAGQPVGQVGCTGSCDGPHLHFEVRIGRADFGAETKAIDPLPLMRQWPQRPTS